MAGQVQSGVSRPFHETIVEAILRTEHAIQWQTLGRLIIATAIPRNHDAILAAWRSTVDPQFDYDRVDLYIVAQKTFFELANATVKGGADDEGREVVFDATTARSDLADPNDVCGSE